MGVNENFTAIYKILSYLEKNLDYPDIDLSPISAGTLKITPERWEQLLIMLCENRYVKGIKVNRRLVDTKEDIAYFNKS